MKKRIYDKLVELFISKNKELKPVMAKVWVEKLCEKYCEKSILYGIDKMIWDKDDFPTLGKISEYAKLLHKALNKDEINEFCISSVKYVSKNCKIITDQFEQNDKKNYF